MVQGLRTVHAARCWRWGSPWHLAACLSVVMAAVLPLLPALGADFLNYDDPAVVLGQPFLQDSSLGGVIQCLSPFPYREEPLPLRDLTYWINFAVHGPWAPGFIAVNLFLYACISVLVFWLGARVLRLGTALSEAGSRAAALAGALVFALHPVHGESVLWISSRKDILSGVFYLLSVGVWLTYLRSTPGEGRRPYLAALGCYLLALFSKASVVSLPGILFAADLFLGPRRPLLQRIRDQVPFACLTLGFVKTYSWLLRQWGATNEVGSSIIEELPGEWLPTLVYTDLHALRVYLQDFFCPWQTTLFRDEAYQTEFSGLVALGLVVCLVVGLGAIVFSLRSRAGGFCVAWFFMALVPFMNLIPTGIPYATRYGFLSSVAGSFLIGWGVARLAARAGRAWQAKLLGLALGLIAIPATWNARNWAERFVEPVQLWRRVQEEDPANWHAAFGLGHHALSYVDKSGAARDPAVEAEFERELSGLSQAVSVVFARGVLAERRGDEEAALRYYRHATRWREGVGMAQHLALASLLCKRSRRDGFPPAGEVEGVPEWEEALLVCERALERWPRQGARAARLRAEILQEAGKFEAAEAAWRIYLARYGMRNPARRAAALAALRELKDKHVR